MTSIIQHIEYLIQRNDCVILPGIGAVVAEYIPAMIDFETGRITAPQRIISLNSAINHDDGMLATSISRAEQIKFEDAREMMRHAMTEIRNTLAAEREYPLGKYGRLVLGEEDRLIFRPSQSPEDAAKSMGMPAIGSNLVVESTQAVPTTSEPALKSHEYSKILSNRNYYIAINKVFARSIAAVIVLVAFTLPFIMPRQAQSPSQINASLNPVETLTSARTSSAIEIEQQTATDGRTEVDTTSEDIEAATAQPEMQYLIVATFKSKNQAEEYISKHAESPFTLQTVEHKGTYRIYAACGDEVTVRSILSLPDFKAEHPKAWIWSR